MLKRPLLALALLAAAAVPLPAAAEPAEAAVPLPEELVIAGEPVVSVTVNGVPLRLEVSGEAFGPPIVNPEVAARLMLPPETGRGWRFGPVVVEGHSAPVTADFGAGAVPLILSWADLPASDRADGVIGVHDLPHARVTFALRPPATG